VYGRRASRSNCTQITRVNDNVVSLDAFRKKATQPSLAQAA
jgi:hypothetical protein